MLVEHHLDTHTQVDTCISCVSHACQHIHVIRVSHPRSMCCPLRVARPDVALCLALVCCACLCVPVCCIDSVHLLDTLDRWRMSTIARHTCSAQGASGATRGGTEAHKKQARVSSSTATHTRHSCICRICTYTHRACNAMRCDASADLQLLRETTDAMHL